MLKFLDKYEKYLVYIIYSIFSVMLYLSLNFKDVWESTPMLLIAVPFIIYFLGKYVFGGLIILFLRFIAHLVEHKNLNLYLEDVENRDTTQATFLFTRVILVLIFYIICYIICIILLTFIFEFLFQDYGIHFVDKLENYWFLLLIGYPISIGIIFWLAYLVRLNPFAVLVSLVGLVILLPNLFRYNVNQIESIEKLLATVKIFFGLLFLILPWLFDRSYKRIE